MTNFERLKEMTAEEFADWLIQRDAEYLPLFACTDYCRFYVKHGRCAMNGSRLVHGCPLSDTELWKGWLNDECK